MPDYTYSEMRSMQQDAIQRVMEMQRIANERLGIHNSPPEEVQHSERNRQDEAPRPVHNRQNNTNNQSQPQNRNRSERAQGHADRPEVHHHTLPTEIRPPAHQSPAEPFPFLSSGALEGFVKRLGLETDQLILMGLLLLLINEGADTMLILAVFYLLI